MLKRTDRNSGALRSQAAMISDSQIAGFVFDPSDPGRRFVVEMLIDGFPAGVSRADLFDRELAREGAGDGCHGFVFTLDPSVLHAARRVEIRLANSGDIVGAPLFAPAAAPPKSDRSPGEVGWDGGLRMTGWVDGDPSRAQTIRALIDGEQVAETKATRWTHIGEGHEVRAFRRFDLDLPLRFADGLAHVATVLNEEGTELVGSPCGFVAFRDGLARFLESRAELDSEKPRGDFYDRIVPQSLPLDFFAQWREIFPPPAPEADARSLVGVALVGDEGIEDSVAGLEAQRGCGWVAAALEGGESAVDFDPAMLREFLAGDAKDCPILAFAPSGTVLQPHALAVLAQALAAFPAAPLVYADFTFAEPDGGEWPVALPAFDYERMLEQGCGALFFAARAEFVHAAAEAGAADLFRLFFFAQDRRRVVGPRIADPDAGQAAAAPVHQPGFLARLPRLDLAKTSARLTRAVQGHLAARGVQGRIGPGRGALLPSAIVARPAPRGRVSILIPTRDRADLLKACFDSLARTVDLAACEVVVLDNDSVEPETAALFEEIAGQGGRVLPVPGPFNFSRIVNRGAEAAGGDFLLLLNNDVEALRTGWLEEMLSRMAEPDVGAVGAALLWPSAVVQHGGVVLGPKFAALHAFNDRIDSDPGYADLLRVAHECSAVTAACLLTERRLFLDSGGFDEARFPVNFNDVDYCLRLRARGLRVVLTPHARLLHRESATRGPERRPDQAFRSLRELRNLRAIWGEALTADPAYHPMLSLDQTPFSALAWPPRPAPPRLPVWPQPRPVPPGF
ncbi:glycosyltransferase family 2 protein [Rhodoblastus acidophilus]|uniref:Glycosyltransferase family 2 protein n=1 Tax=Candidatus Rhodoblastus alkanivorans TaxID=2954117 RepID=A0ABS9Z1H7_9HYPH|nr:glycosyltransferase family 2 protein [Candidatus Rhodoblastus alkanivorans]MCI4678576.1 glycosyltransferase family 2 protein [Candidatus Rhodoblastus alkanivorans]MCI4681336.1 glycosyltransferase family 2 protein [Candidatus Rhodoblastus alkanivorans]